MFTNSDGWTETTNRRDGEPSSLVDGKIETGCVIENGVAIVMYVPDQAFGCALSAEVSDVLSLYKFLF